MTHLNNPFQKTMVALATAVLVVGCGTTTKYENPDKPSDVTGVGIESQDIRAMTDQMAQDLLATPIFANSEKVPYVIIDDGYFTNESSAPINKRLITERLMIELNRAAAGKMMFVERQASAMVEAERQKKRSGEVAEGSKPRAAKQAGADYRLTGKIMSLDAVDKNNGGQSRYHQITFKMVDLERGLTVWSNLYEFKKFSEENILYR